jgi:regulatory protein
MPIISEITKQKRNKNRYNVFLDGEYSGSLNVDEMAINGIKTGLEIDKKTFDEIIDRDNKKYAFNLALKYISFKRRTIAETKKYLLSKDIDVEIAENAISKVLEYGYLDDLEYAVDFVSYHLNSKKYGKIIVKYKLKEKGVDEETADKALEAYNEKIEFEVCKKRYEILNKKYIDLPKIQQREKIYRGLASKGFSYDIISMVLNNEEEL